MADPTLRRSRRADGFTLIELMVVIVILGLLVTIVAPRFGTILEDAKVETTKTQMANIEKVVDIYRLKKGKLPESLNDLLGDEGLLPGTELPTDGWGNEFQYNKIDKKRYDLVSLGADGQEGGESHDSDIHIEDVHKKAKDN